MIRPAVMVEIKLADGSKLLELRENDVNGAVLFCSPTYHTIRQKVDARLKLELWAYQNSYMTVGYYEQ